jgi:DNA polymerase-3 subunit delta'
VSGLLPLRGHTAARRALARAANSGELPGSLLLHGPAGVGKQRLALWLAQLLLCEQPAAEPCGTCRACRLVLGLEHPDLHWFFPMVRPKGGGSPEKLAELMEEGRAEELALRRADPCYSDAGTEPTGLLLPQILTLRRYAVSRPAMAARQVFIVGDAELLVPQESSPEAANAMLKVLEEPPRDTTFVLTTADPDGLLPTIRSRLLPLRLDPLPQAEVARFLIEQRAVPPADAERLARLAQGAIGRALGFLPAGQEPGPLEKLRHQARTLLEAATGADATTRLALALATPTAAARGAFSDVLDFLALWIRDLAAVAAGAPELVVNADAAAELQTLARRLPHAARAAPALLHHLDEARALAHGNVNPQLIVARLLVRMAEVIKQK